MFYSYGMLLLGCSAPYGSSLELGSRISARITMASLQKRCASRELFYGSPIQRNTSLVKPKVEVEVIEDESGEFTMNALWFQPAAPITSVSPKKSTSPPSASTKKKRTYRRNRPPTKSQIDGILPGNLVEFILEDELDFQVVPEKEYEACLKFLMNGQCRKTQITKVCKLLGVSPRPSSKKRRYTKKNVKCDAETLLSSPELQSTSIATDTSIDNSFLSETSMTV